MKQKKTGRVPRSNGPPVGYLRIRFVTLFIEPPAMTTRCVDWRRKSANGSPRLPLLNHISHLGWVFFVCFFFTGFRCDVDWFNLRGRLWLEKGGRRGTQVARRLIGWDRYLVFFPALPSFIVVLLRFLFFWWKKRENCGFVCWHLLRSWPSSTRVFKEKCSFFLFFFGNTIWFDWFSKRGSVI